MVKSANKKLLIVESPAKAKTISKYLNDLPAQAGEYTVKASVGHIRDLPKSNKNAIDIEGGFIPHYEISKGKEKVVSELRSAASKASEVVLATDPDREGEAIAWHVAEAIGLKNPKRIVFHEITKEAVEEAMAHPREIDDNLKTAQEARRVLDRLFGYDLSGLIWQKLRYGLSAGRVQSPALRILVEREREIRAFIPEKFWVIDAMMSGIPFVGSVEPKTEEEANKIVEQAKQSSWKVADIKQSEVNRRARAPFTTSTLQQYASSRLGYSPAVTMRLAQKLYEAGQITYMRTDSTNLSQHALTEIGELVKSKFGANYHERQVYATKSKNAQEAHEAIRPSHPSQLIAGHSPLEQKLYKLIWARTVASQMAAAKLLKTKIIAEASPKASPLTSNSQGEALESGEASAIPLFWANGSVVTFDGWLKADPAARGEENVLPTVNVGQELKLESITSTGKETQGPGHYSEAGLVKELEKRGIGRPSTYAPTIKTIIDRGYVEKDGRSLKPTETGEVVNEFLEKHFTQYISDDFTREMEDDLDEIAEGKRDYVKTLAEFYNPFKKEVASKKKLPKLTNLGAAPADIKCPVCGGPMIIKLGKAGKFLSCAEFPDCSGARTIDGQELAGPKETGEPCPECGRLPAGRQGKLIERNGRFGKFVACTNYPKCKYIKKDATIANPANNTNVKCPVCNDGTMVEKRGRYGPFYGCSNYPKCKNIIKTKPTGNLCSTCNSLMMAGTKTIPERCSNKACANHNPHQIAKLKNS
ncbi:MAG: type I DNA topoisomerase [Candidatus Vogelbacteria bacterium]|nr:type I DNA topoisomerase [Candidatus Vogelbacteria bacterium]